MLVNFIQHLPLEPQPESTLTFGSTLELDQNWVVGTVPHCINCSDYVQANDELGYCLSEDAKAYLEGGMQAPIKDPNFWVCPCHKLKASKGRG